VGGKTWGYRRGGTESPGRRPVGPEFVEREPLEAETTMHTEAAVRRAAGRLSRDDQRRLGDILKRVYDDVVRQGVPDRFKDLLNELDGPAASADQEHPGAARDRNPGSEHAVDAKALDNKGSS
jgi:Anti-sigma factor NepR